MRRRHANRLVKAFEVVDEMGPIGTILPAAETQVRPLTSVPDADVWQRVWNDAVE